MAVKKYVVEVMLQGHDPFRVEFEHDDQRYHWKMQMGRSEEWIELTDGMGRVYLLAEERRTDVEYEGPIEKVWVLVKNERISLWKNALVGLREYDLEVES